MNPAGTPTATKADPTEPTGTTSEVSVEVAHEALIQRWPRAQSWINPNRVALGLRQEISEAADDWHDAGANPMDEDRLIHRGPTLTLAEALPNSLHQGFNRREREYLDACIEQRKRAQSRESAQRRRELDVKNRWLKIVAVVAVVAIGLAAVSTLLYAEQQRQARANLALALAAYSMSEFAAGHSEEAALLARQAHSFDGDGAAQAQIAEALQLTAGSPYFSTLAGSQHSWLSGIAFSPDGRQIATSSDDHTVGLMNIEDQNATQNLLKKDTAWVASVAFHPQVRQNLLASGGGDGMVRLWEADGGEPLGSAMAGPGGVINSLAFDGGTRLAAGSCLTAGDAAPTGAGAAPLCKESGGIVRIWTIDDAVRASASPGSTWQEPRFEDRALEAQRVCAVAFSPDGRWLAAAGCYGTPNKPATCADGSGPLVVWDMTQPADADPICLNGHQGSVWSVVFSPDGTKLASGGSDTSVRLWNIAAITPGVISIGAYAALNGHDEDVRSVSFSGDGQLLATGSHDGTVGLWYVAGFEPSLFRLGSTTEWVRAVAFGGESGRMLATTSAGGTFRIWDLRESGVAPSVLRGHTDYVRSLAYSPVSTGAGPPSLASGSNDNTVRVWNFTETGVQPIVLPMDESPGSTISPDDVSSVSFSRDGLRLAAASENGVVRLWNKVDGSAPPMVVVKHAGGNTIVAFNPAQDYFSTVGSPGDIFFWDLQGQQIGMSICLELDHDCRKKTAAIIAFSPDGSLLAAGGDDGTVRVWSLENGPENPREVATFTVESAVNALAFRPDNSVLAIGGTDSITTVWSVASQRIVESLSGHDGAVRSVAFSPSGDQLVTGGNDQIVMIRDANDLDAPPIQIRDLAEWIRAVAFSADGSSLAAVSTQGTIRLVATQTASVADRACQVLTRNLSGGEWDQFVGDDDDLDPLDWLLRDDLSKYRQTCPNLPSGRDAQTGETATSADQAIVALSESTTLRRPDRRKRGYRSWPRRSSLRGSLRTGPGVRSVGTRWESQPPTVSAAVRRRPIGPECWATTSA